MSPGLIDLLAGAPGALAAYLSSTLGAGRVAAVVALLSTLTPTASLALAGARARLSSRKPWAWSPPLAALASMALAALGGSPAEALAAYYILLIGMLAPLTPEDEASMPWATIAVASSAAIIVLGAESLMLGALWASLAPVAEHLSAGMTGRGRSRLAEGLLGSASSGYLSLLAGLPPSMILTGLLLSGLREALAARNRRGIALLIDIAVRGVLVALWIRG